MIYAYSGNVVFQLATYLGGSFASGGAALIMTGTLYGTAHFHWVLGLLLRRGHRRVGALTVGFLCKPPTKEQMAQAVQASAEKEVQQAKPAVA